jgi:hypothetical protein
MEGYTDRLKFRMEMLNLFPSIHRRLWAVIA